MSNPPRLNCCPVQLKSNRGRRIHAYACTCMAMDRPTGAGKDLAALAAACAAWEARPIVLMNLFSYRRSAFHVEDYSTLIGAKYELSRTCVNATTGKD